MADVDKAITIEDQQELGVRDRSKEMELEVEERLTEKVLNSWA